MVFVAGRTRRMAFVADRTRKMASVDARRRDGRMRRPSRGGGSPEEAR
jgi:hypothetical protein